MSDRPIRLHDGTVPPKESRATQLLREAIDAVETVCGERSSTSERGNALVIAHMSVAAMLESD